MFVFQLKQEELQHTIIMKIIIKKHNLLMYRVNFIDFLAPGR